jgi:4-hydroxy-3-polyprenylbenzoate decarboxylase
LEKLIHEITGQAIQQEIPGLKEVHAVDAAGVHPLLLAIGSERYTPYNPVQQPAELLTIANRIFGTGQLSLAKFLWITADESNELHTVDIPCYLQFVLSRIDLKRDIHFYTHTTIDTLDYSGDGLNSGSKVIFAAYGEVCRQLSSAIPIGLESLAGFSNSKILMPGVLVLQAHPFMNYEKAAMEMESLNQHCMHHMGAWEGIPLIIVGDDADFIANQLNNFLRVDIYQVQPIA